MNIYFKVFKLICKFYVNVNKVVTMITRTIVFLPIVAEIMASLWMDKEKTGYLTDTYLKQLVNEQFSQDRPSLVSSKSLSLLLSFILKQHSPSIPCSWFSGFWNSTPSHADCMIGPKVLFFFWWKRIVLCSFRFVKIVTWVSWFSKRKVRLKARVIVVPGS